MARALAIPPLVLLCAVALPIGRAGSGVAGSASASVAVAAASATSPETASLGAAAAAAPAAAAGVASPETAAVPSAAPAAAGVASPGAAAAAGSSPASAPASRPAAVDEATWQRMLAVDAKAAQVADLTADFEQEKFTAMLKKPLTSTGRVLVKGSTMLWDTRRPEPTQLRIDAREARIYYPQQETIEVYAIQQKLGQLAASPLPRLSALQEHFTFAPLATKALGEPDDTRFLALVLTPVSDALREHVEDVRVLLDAQAGLIIRLEMRDADGERTRITFSNAKPNVGLSDADLEIRSPPGVKVSRPLGGLEGQPSK